MTMNNVSDLVGKVQKPLINTFGRLPDVRDVNISTVAEGEKVFLIIECAEKFKDKLKSILEENDYTVICTDKDSSISELRKEIQYVEDRYNAPVEVLDALVREVNDKLWEYEATITELRNELNRIHTIPAVPNKKFVTRTIDVFKQQVESNIFVYVGTMTDNVLTLNQSATVLETHVTKPSTYFTDWFVKNTNPELGCQWLDVHPSNKVNEILVKERYMTNFVTTGYLTDEGRAIYYDQYL